VLEEQTESPLKTEAHTLLLEKSAILCGDETVSGPEAPFSVRCFMGHKFDVSLARLQAGEWCGKCAGLLEKCQKFAAEMGGQCLAPHFLPMLQFSCNLGHVWSVSHWSWSKKWCCECRRNERETQKKLLDSMRQEREDAYRRKQAELFAEAQRKLDSGENQNFDRIQRRISQKTVEAYKKIEPEIDRVASEYAKTCPEAFYIYKIILMPEEILAAYLRNLPEKELKSEFRAYARQIHPDKCSHPKANSAFQKLHACYSLALQSSN